VTVVGVGLDLSLSATGVAVAHPGEVPYSITIKSDPVENARYPATHARLVDITARILAFVEQHTTEGDRIVFNIEEPAISATGKKMVHIRDGLWWMVYHFAAKRGVIVTTQIQHLKQYATNNGGASKEAMLLAAERAFPDVEVANNNEADAAWLAAMVMRSLGHPFELSPQRCYPGYLSKVLWPAWVSAYRDSL
jgi:crossover junction endodeoxyribonuclease RuvC